MDLAIIETIFALGKFAALTPSSTKDYNPHWLRKLYEMCLYAAYVVCFVTDLYINQSELFTLTYMQLVIAILSDFNIFFFTSYIVVVMLRLRRDRWFKLVENLSRVGSSPSRFPFRAILATSQVVYWCLISFGLYAGVRALGLSYVAPCLVQCYQYYAAFFYLVLTSIVLMLLLSRYQHLNETLVKITKVGTQHWSSHVAETLKEGRRCIFFLNQSVEIFNDIFGWTILCSIFTIVSATLVYVDMLIKKTYMFIFASRDGAMIFFYNLSFILIIWTGVLSTIMLCDLILKTLDEILEQAYILENQLTWYEGKEIKIFIDVVLHNRPEFRAARFFLIDRSTFFSILYSLTTFLVVIIQFKEL